MKFSFATAQDGQANRLSEDVCFDGDSRDVACRQEKKILVPMGLQDVQIALDIETSRVICT